MLFARSVAAAAGRAVRLPARAPQLMRITLGGNITVASMRFWTILILGAGVSAELLLYLDPPLRLGPNATSIHTGWFVAYALVIAAATLAALAVETWFYEHRRRSPARHELLGGKTVAGGGHAVSQPESRDRHAHSLLAILFVAPVFAARDRGGVRFAVLILLSLVLMEFVHHVNRRLAPHGCSVARAYFVGVPSVAAAFLTVILFGLWFQGTPGLLMRIGLMSVLLLPVGALYVAARQA